jgi:putative flavoprotein involved in K+ transport
LSDLGQYDLPVDQHPAGEKVRRKANHYLTGRGGGRDIDLRKFATEGMRLYGRVEDVTQGKLIFRDDLAQNLDAADAVYNGICQLIDKHIVDRCIEAPAGSHYQPLWRPGPVARELDPAAAGIAAIVWSTGFHSDYSWVEVPIFDGMGYPMHQRGVTSVDGLYVLGLPWLYTWGSGRFVGVGRDAAFIADHLEARAGVLRRRSRQAAG